MKRGSPERLSGQIIPDNLLPGFGLTDLPRIPRISRTVFVGLITHTTHITHHFRRLLLHHPGGKIQHNFKHRLKQRDLAARRLQPRAQIFVRTLWPLPVVQESRDMSRRWVEVCALSALCALGGSVRLKRPMRPLGGSVRLKRPMRPPFHGCFIAEVQNCNRSPTIDQGPEPRQERHSV